MIWVIAWFWWTLALSGAAQDPVPKVINVKSGSDVILECDTGRTFDLINWRLNGSKSPIFIKFMNFKPFVDSRFARRLHMVNRTAILISQVTGSDAGIYRCKTMATSTGDTAGIFKQGTPLVLKIQVPPFFLKQPLDRITAPEGTSVNLECLVDGTPKPKVEWERLGGILPLDRLTRTAGGWLTLTRVEASDAGRYKCYVSNSLGSLTHEIDLVVQRSANTVPSRSKKATEGNLAVLDCQTGTNLPTTNVIYTWTNDGRDIISPPNPRISILISGSLFLRGILRSDSGVYKCTAKTFDMTASGIVTYPGSDIFLDVQFPPDIIVIREAMTVAEGTDVRLPCVSEANPATEITRWSHAGDDLGTLPRFLVLQKGTLLIRTVKLSDMGVYACTPSNSIGIGKPRTTRLVVQVAPKFTEVPPSVITRRIGDDVELKCSAVSETTTTVAWERVGKPLSNRTKTEGGTLSIMGVKREDHGEYNCIASTSKGRAIHTTTITVIATPSKPKVTMVTMVGKIATITWIAGYDGGFPQKFEVWYRMAKATDYQWKNTDLLPLGALSYEVRALEKHAVYFFAVRGINSEGAGAFSDVTQGGEVSTPSIPAKPDKPLPPTDVIVNITSQGYVLSWRHDPVPGRPSVEKFVIQYRKKNASASWLVADNGIAAEKRTYTLRAEVVDPKADYEFRVFAYGNSFSKPAYVSRTYHIGTPVIAERTGTSDVIPIVAGVLGAIAFIVLIGLVCFCFVQLNAGRKAKSKKSKKVHFVLPDGTTQTYEGDSDDDFCDAEIKLRPEAVRFIPDESYDERPIKRQIAKEDDLLFLTSREEPFGVQMVRQTETTIESLDDSPVQSPRDKVRFFGDAGPSGWYDCTLARPASSEVRDSYDQFCTSPSDVGSRDSLDRVSRKRALYEHKGSKIHLLKKFDSNSSLQFDRGGQQRGPRFKVIQEELEVTKGDVALRRSHKHPHHWSTPEVFIHRDDSSSDREGRDSDSDSLDSFGRGHRRRARPASYYEGYVSHQPDLVPISEQDSEPSFRCLCDDDDDDKPNGKQAKNGNEDNCDSSYLHLERTDSQRMSYVDQLKTWEEDVDTSVGKPYESHVRTKHGCSNNSDSDNSVSPAHSLVSLSDSDVDAEIAQNLHEDENSDSKRLSFAGEPDKSHLFRAVSYLMSVETGSSSDASEKNDQNDKVNGNHRQNPPTYKDKKPDAVTNLKDLTVSDSLDQLKACDPFYRGLNSPHSRSPSNASSGIFSVQVSSSETNSIESPHEFSRFSKGSARSSGTSSSGFETSSTRGSYGSEGRHSAFRPVDPAKANALRNASSQRFPHLEEPYEWDREGTGSELESGSDTGGFSYKPNMIANMRHLLHLQRRLGIDLDSGSSSESLSDKTKFENMSAPEVLDFSPNVSPTKYKVDRYSMEEKDKRCSKLMEEYKASKKVQDEKLNGSVIYRSWDL